MRVLSIITMNPATATPSTQEVRDRMSALCAQMHREGVLIDTGGACEGELELSVARRSGTYTVTDGPFTEAKEIVGGYALLEVADREEAIRVTERFLDHFGGDATCHLHEVQSPLESAVATA